MGTAAARTDLLSQAAYAALRGVSKQAISKLVRSGKITTIGGKIDPGIADMQLTRELDPARAKTLRSMPGAAAAAAASSSAPAVPAADGQPPSVVVDINTYAGARAVREKAEAQRAVLEYERLRGAVVDVEGVKRAAMEVSRSLRDSLMGSAVRIGPGLVGITDPGEMVRRLEGEMRRVLDNAAKSISTHLERLSV